MDFSKSPAALAAFALGLLGLGFVGGYGYGFGVRGNAPQVRPTPLPNATPNATPGAVLLSPAPLVKGLRAAPDDKHAAFTAIYDQSRLSSRIVLHLQSGQYRSEQAPPGWQDYITQWSADGTKLLFERERIPRPVADATAGLYAVPLFDAKGAPLPPETAPELLTQGVDVPGEKITAGFWTPSGQLALKTRREPKTLWLLENGVPRLVDRAGVNFQQHRAVRENGKTVFYTVRDVPGDSGIAVLFRVEEGRAVRLSEDLPDAIWIYLEENARRMIVCRRAANGTDWEWTVYQVTPQKAVRQKTAIISGDVITVYWSPDGKHILGAGGQSLWLIEIPSLKSRRLSARTQWNADDACWLWKEPAVLVAADGAISKVSLSGTVTELWKFPAAFWK
jgi:hypothetical protein